MNVCMHDVFHWVYMYRYAFICIQYVCVQSKQLKGIHDVVLNKNKCIDTDCDVFR